jgi:hypothetical protein
MRLENGARAGSDGSLCEARHSNQPLPPDPEKPVIFLQINSTGTLDNPDALLKHRPHG